MALLKTPYKGTRDLFPKEKRIQEYLFSVMKKSAESFGYEPYDGPLLEEVELYLAKSGEELINEQIYSFIDRGERKVAIRPEMTPTLARMVAQVHREIAKPIRWYAIPNLMRYENPQKGRLREHWQFNCDIFGADENISTIEILQLVTTFLKNYGANETHFGISLNDRRIVDGLFKKILEFTNEESYKLYKVIDKSKKVSSEALDKMIAAIISDQNKIIIFKEYLNVKNFSEISLLLKKLNLNEENNFLVKFIEQLEILGLTKFVEYDPTIVRGLDYYTGIVFEVFDKHPDNKRAIAGGGAYANLLQIFNEPALAGIGFGLGDVTLTDFLKVHNLLPDFSLPTIELYVTFQCEEAQIQSLKFANDLRGKNISVETGLHHLSFKKVFTVAEKRGATFVSMIGEDEYKHDKVIIKNLKTKDQKTFLMNDLNEIFKFIKG